MQKEANMMVTVSLEMHRALERQYDRAVRQLEELMKAPMSGCGFCAKEKTCGKRGTDCVPVWKGRRQ